MALAGCQSSAPVQNIDQSSVPGNLSAEEVYDAIVEGGQVRGWKVRQVEPGLAEATIFVRSHVARVSIPYDSEGYSIQCKDSENLDYEDGRIHENYKKWVENLDGDIQRAMVY